LTNSTNKPGSDASHENTYGCVFGPGRVLATQVIVVVLFVLASLFVVADDSLAETSDDQTGNQLTTEETPGSKAGATAGKYDEATLNLLLDEPEEDGSESSRDVQQDEGGTNITDATMSEILAKVRLNAREGHIESMLQLGHLYENPKLGTVNKKKAYFWFWLVAMRNDARGISAASKVGEQLTLEQRISIQRLASGWQPANGSGKETGDEVLDSVSLNLLTKKTGPGSYSNTRRRRYGSGFFVAPGLLVTSKHVVARCPTLRVNRENEAQLVATDSNSDLALLKLQFKGRALPISSNRARVGEQIMIAGYAFQQFLANGPHVITGNISAMMGIRGDQKALQFSAPTQLGYSGGPVLDYSGSIVGVVKSQLHVSRGFASVSGDMPRNIGFAVAPQTLRAFLDSNTVKYKLRKTAKRRRSADLAEHALKSTVYVECMSATL